MHRFLDYRTIGRAAQCDLVLDDPGVTDIHARLALRADGAIWLLGDAERPCLVDRGSGWAAATRLCLCAGDRIRLAGCELSPAELCRLFGVEPEQLGAGETIASEVPGLPAPAPLLLRPEVLEKARRDPGTGQIEHARKEGG